MKMRKNTKTGEKVSLLGFGCMRFPTTKNGKINEPLAKKMIDYAYDHGVNYYDTAWLYHGGESETFTAKVLRKYPRDSYYLATKIPSWVIKKPEQAHELFEKQLEKCQVDYFDYYLVHSLTTKAEFNRVYEKMGVLKYLQEQKAKGHIRKLGFSFHGSMQFLKHLLKTYEWDFAQIQLNYLDWDINKAGEMYELLADAGIPCIVMEPVRGGMLAKLNPESLKMLQEAAPEKSAASWALRYVAELPNVLTVLSGMSTMEQVEDNVATLENFKPLTKRERELLAQTLDVYLKNRPIPCTACRYCMPCPFKVDIPGVFTAYNEIVGHEWLPDVNGPRDETFKQKAMFFDWRMGSLPKNHQAHNCTACGACVKKCPQHIQIPQNMKMIAELVAKIF